jgi:S-adenosylmethionine synthetase
METETTDILVTGASGLLGRAVYRVCRQVPGWQVDGVAYQRAEPHALHRLNLCDHQAVKEYLAARQPRILVHCAAERRPDQSERDPAATLRLNVEATARLAKWAAAAGAWLIYLSTDYVFDGVTPPYAPEAPTNPLNFYGRSKRDGELAVWAETADACVLRVPILYGEVERLEESAVTDLARQIRVAHGAPLTIEDWATRYPTCVTDVAVVLRQMIQHRLQHPEFRGTFHWSGTEAFTKYTMARVIADSFGINADTLHADPRPPAGAPRPKDCQLDCSDLERLQIGQRSPFAATIARILQPHG